MTLPEEILKTEKKFDKKFKFPVELEKYEKVLAYSVDSYRVKSFYLKEIKRIVKKLVNENSFKLGYTQAKVDMAYMIKNGR